MSVEAGATLVVRGLTIGHDPVILAEAIDLVVAPGHVIGLVGPNGAGKTTFLRTLAGLVGPGAGSVSAAPPDATIGYLPQEVQSDAPEGETVAAFLLRRTGVGEAEVAMEEGATELAAGTPGADVRYGDALERWLALGGADFEPRAAAVRAELGLDVPDDQPVVSLSGGQAGRLGLASLLLARFGVFLLDEPTNNLDLDGLRRLEQLMADLRVPVVLVSHDRTFLEATATEILELDPLERKAGLFGGGYRAYLDERDVARRHAQEAFDDYADTRSDLLDRARTVRNWTYQGVKKAKAKKPDGDKIGAKKRAESSEKMAGKASRLEKAAERLDEVVEPRKVWQLQYSIASAARSGSLVASLRGAVVERGSFRLGPVDLDVHAGDRIVVTGPNGGGKSTLLGALLGQIELSAGTRRAGSGVAVGSLDQTRELFDGAPTLVDAVRRELPALTVPEIRTLLAKFGLGADDVHRPTSSLSPGERTRAVLALFQARSVNCLVLDEPTNHLDLPAIEQLEQALDGYDATLLLVTHDRRMLETVSITRHLRVDHGVVDELAASAI